MMQNGLLDEVKRLLEAGVPEDAQCMKAIGYRQLIPCLTQGADLHAAQEEIKQESRRYAKRQITWFKRDSEINWIYIDEYNSFEEIDFEKLPNQFVIKPTHTSGDVYICTDKSNINYKELENKIKKWLKRKYFFYQTFLDEY